MVRRIGRTVILCMLFAPAFSAGVSATAWAQAVLPFASLEAYIADLKSRLPGRNSQAFIVPAAAEAAAFTDAVHLLLNGHTAAAAAIVHDLKYDLLTLADTTYGKSYLVLQERKAGFRGLGTYIVDPDYDRNLVFEVPHPLYDVNTPEQGRKIFQETGARALFIAGTHRCANYAYSGCSGTTTACSGIWEPYRISDVAHFDGNFMQAAHQALLLLQPPPLAINLHGQSSEPQELILSDGTRFLAAETAIVNRLRTALRARGVQAFSCNMAADNPSSLALCGTTNVQGRLSNGSADPCRQAATASSGLFLHLESRLNLRNDPAPLIAAFREIVESTPRTPPEAILYFPVLQTAAAAALPPEAAQHTGYAVVNAGRRSASLTVTALNSAGLPIHGVGLNNPAILPLPAEAQRARIDYQLFGGGLLSDRRQGWLRLESSVREVAGFFMAFDENLAWLDGADASTVAGTALLFPEVETGGFTRLHLANPGTTPATASIELWGEEGELRTAPAARTVPAGGVLVESLDTLFPSVGHHAANYVRVSSDLPLVGCQLFGRSGRFLQVLNALDANGGASVLYSPQYVTWGTGWRTVLTLVNLSADPATALIQLMADDGMPLSSEREVRIAPRGKQRLEDAQFFGYDAEARVSGYVRIRSSGPRLAGSVVFGDRGHSFYSTALPLVSELSDAFVFSHLASDAVYYTGLALLNPGPLEAAMTLEVLSPEGRQLASGLVTLPPNQRRSRLLTEYLPELAGKEIAGGYLLLRATRPVAAIAVFGTTNNTAVSAIPAQKIPR